MLLLHHFARAKESSLQVISYDSPAIQLSGDLLLVAEDLIKNKWENIEFLGVERGIAYHRGGQYLVGKGQLDRKKLTKETPSKIMHLKNKSELVFFESNRSFLVVSKEAPELFIKKIKALKNQQITYLDDVLELTDLSWGNVGIGYLPQRDFLIFDFKKNNWSQSNQWDISVFMTYKLAIKGQKFEVTVFPKAFGGATRTASAVSRYKSRNSLILGQGLGDLLSLDETTNDLKLISQFADQLGKQYVLGSISAIIGHEKYKDFYKFLKEKDIFILSANLLQKNENDTKQTVFEPYKIITIDNLKIALIGINSPGANDQIEKLSGKYAVFKSLNIENPKDLLEKEILPKVRNQVDLVFILSGLTAKEEIEFLRPISGLDFVFSSSNLEFEFNKKTQVLFRQFKKRTPRTFMYNTLSSRNKISVSQIIVSDSDISITNEHKMLDQKYSLGDLNEAFTRQFLSITSYENIVLPDHRRLYPNRISPSEEEFANLAAEIMRKCTQSEVAFFNIQTQYSDIPGDMDASIIKAWIREHEHLVVGYLKGSDILQLISSNATFEKNYKIAYAGVRPDKTISGLPINANEYYRVATTTGLAENTTKYPVLSGILKKNTKFVSKENSYEESLYGSPVALTDLITKDLIITWKSLQNVTDDKKNSYYKNLYEGKNQEDLDGYWVHKIKDFRLEYSELNTTNLSAFGGIQDNRIVTTDQKTFSGLFRFASSFRKEPLLSELGVNAQYSKLELLPVNGSPISNTLGDEFSIYGNLGLPLFKNPQNWLSSNMGPVTELVYTSEFERNPNEAYKKSVLSFIGWKFYNGILLNTSSVSIFNENRLTEGLKKNVLGANIRFEINKSVLQNSSIMRSELDYKYYFSSADDNNEDLRSRIVLDNYLDLKINKRVSFGPFFKYAAFTGKVFNGTAVQTTMGFNFNFSAFWKPRYQQYQGGLF